MEKHADFIVACMGGILDFLSAYSDKPDPTLATTSPTKIFSFTTKVSAFPSPIMPLVCGEIWKYVFVLNDNDTDALRPHNNMGSDG